MAPTAAGSVFPKLRPRGARIPLCARKGGPRSVYDPLGAMSLFLASSSCAQFCAHPQTSTSELAQREDGVNTCEYSGLLI